MLSQTASSIDGDASVSSSSFVLDTFVMDNGICVLTIPERIVNEKLKFNKFELLILCNSAHVSGKQKKGAQNIHAGNVILSINIASTESIPACSIDLVTPIGGKLLEVNDNLNLNPRLLIDESQGAGYVAILFPENEIPSIDGCTDFEALKEKMRFKSTMSRVCYAWQKGECNRGDSCKFSHTIS